MTNRGKGLRSMRGEGLRTISFSSGKGGVGKSSLVVNLGLIPLLPFAAGILMFIRSRR